MKTFYVTTLILDDPDKQNVRDQVEANNREDAAKIIFDKYIALGYEILKQKVIEL